jgi:hypothetical protein
VVIALAEVTSSREEFGAAANRIGSLDGTAIISDSIKGAIA